MHPDSDEKGSIAQQHLNELEAENQMTLQSMEELQVTYLLLSAYPLDSNE